MAQDITSPRHAVTRMTTNQNNLVGQPTWKPCCGQATAGRAVGKPTARESQANACTTLEHRDARDRARCIRLSGSTDKQGSPAPARAAQATPEETQGLPAPLWPLPSAVLWAKAQPTAGEGQANACTTVGHRDARDRARCIRLRGSTGQARPCEPASPLWTTIASVNLAARRAVSHPLDLIPQSTLHGTRHNVTETCGHTHDCKSE